MKKIILFLFLFILAGCAQATEQNIEIEQSVSVVTNTLSSSTDSFNQPVEECLVYESFEDANAPKWYVVNDNVMGGRSLGSFKIEKGILTLFGSTNTNGGGFASIRSPLPENILNEYDSVKLRILADNRSYDLTFRDNNRRGISQRQTIVIEQSNDWQTVEINFEDLQPAFFGRTVSAGPFNKSQAQEIGIIINDGLDGEFQLQIDEVEFCKK